MTQIWKVVQSYHQMKFRTMVSIFSLSFYKNIIFSFSSSILVLSIFSCSLLMSSPSHSRSFDFSLTNSKEISVKIHSTIDDSNLHDPNSFTAGKRYGFFNESITVANVGDKPIINPFLIVNNDCSYSFSCIEGKFNLSDNKEDIFAKLISFWMDRKFHDSSLLKEHQDTFAALCYWGYTWCGDNSISLLKLLSYFGIEGRHVPVNNHSVSEYFVDGDWRLVDGDHKTIYYELDNINLASFNEIACDPFLSLRTRRNGVAYQWNISLSSDNTSIFERAIYKTYIYIPVSPSDVLELNEVRSSLYPGESMTYYYDRSPNGVIGAKEPIASARSSLGIIEYVINANKRNIFDKKDSGSPINFQTPYPIYKVVENGTGNERVGLGETVTHCVSLGGIGIHKVYAYASKDSIPKVRKGSNNFQLNTDSKEAFTQVYVNYNEKVISKKVPQVSVSTPVEVFEYVPPKFKVKSCSNIPVERVWWQISRNSDFELIIPNFSQIVPYSDTIELQRISQSFFNSGMYYFRAKPFGQGVWGEWSPVLAFSIKIPSRPIIRNAITDGGRVKLFWESDDPDATFYVFGSDRLDMLPSVYSSEKLVGRRDNNLHFAKNDNMLGKTNDNQFECPYNRKLSVFRVLSKIGDIYSTPSNIAVVGNTALALQLRADTIRNGDQHERIIKSTLQPVDLKKKYFFNFTQQSVFQGVASISGLSHLERGNGTWTNASVMKIITKEPLPPTFKMTINGYPYAATSENYYVTVGNSKVPFKLALGMNKVELKFNDVSSNEIILAIPNPTSPFSLGRSEDKRQLGIMLKSIIIESDSCKCKSHLHVSRRAKRM